VCRDVFYCEKLKLILAVMWNILVWRSGSFKAAFRKVFRRRIVMKKLLVLVLVLGMVSVGSAAVIDTITVTYAGDTFTVTSSAVQEVDLGLGNDPIDGGHSWYSDAVVLTAAGGLGYATVYPGDYDGIDFGTLSGGGFAVGAGDWITFTYTGPRELNGNVIFDFYDYAVGYDPIGTITATPEPMTIALLGLGGLFLRRRK